MRLIDADALRKNLSSRYMNELYHDWRILPEEIKMRIEILAKEFRFALDHAPIIDAVPVVRCEECKHSGTSWYDETGRRRPWCEYWDRFTRPDGFCHAGAKMDGGCSDG